MKVNEVRTMLKGMDGNAEVTIDVSQFLKVYLEELKENLDREGNWDDAIACMAPPSMCVLGIKEVSNQVNLVAEDFIE